MALIFILLFIISISDNNIVLTKFIADILECSDIAVGSILSRQVVNKASNVSEEKTKVNSKIISQTVCCKHSHSLQTHFIFAVLTAVVCMQFFP